VKDLKKANFTKKEAEVFYEDREAWRRASSLAVSGKRK